MCSASFPPMLGFKTQPIDQKPLIYLFQNTFIWERLQFENVGTIPTQPPPHLTLAKSTTVSWKPEGH